jgi:hypothetical protein
MTTTGIVAHVRGRSSSLIDACRHLNDDGVGDLVDGEGWRLLLIKCNFVLIRRMPLRQCGSNGIVLVILFWDRMRVSNCEESTDAIFLTIMDISFTYRALMPPPPSLFDSTLALMQLLNF